MANQEEKVRVAAGQMNPKLKRKDENLGKLIRMVEVAADNGVKLIAFPELALTGLMFDGLEEASSVAEEIPGPSTEKIASTCQGLDLNVVIGLIEREGDKFYNTSVLIGPSGVIGKYRKTHCSAVGIDRYVQKGNDDFEVYETRFGKIGLVICYELRFPEIHRILALKGAEIIVNITNLACNAGLECHQDLLGPTRALENKVYLISASRVGSEREFTFLGRSQIINMNGEVITEASQEKEELIQGIIEPAKARDKRVEWMPEQDLFADRRPELYKPIISAELVPTKNPEKPNF